jgi:mitochondrial fusion and transport protein UGO1
MISEEASPTTFSLAKFCTSTVALFIKLPLETVLRRGQAAVLATPAYVRAVEPKKAKSLDVPTMETIVPVGKFDGVLGTMLHVVSQEGTRQAVPAKAKGAAAKKGKQPKVAETVYRRGQGLPGLWRGWKVSWWGLVGLWAAGVASGGGDGEF